MFFRYGLISNVSLVHRRLNNFLTQAAVTEKAEILNTNISKALQLTPKQSRRIIKTTGERHCPLNVLYLMLQLHYYVLNLTFSHTDHR